MAAHLIRRLWQMVPTLFGVVRAILGALAVAYVRGSASASLPRRANIPQPRMSRTS